MSERERERPQGPGYHRLACFALSGKAERGAGGENVYQQGCRRTHSRFLCVIKGNGVEGGKGDGGEGASEREERACQREWSAHEFTMCAGRR